MRVSREKAEQNRQTVIKSASQLFREHGFDGIGLKDLMRGAGLTQGGFYKQFESKEDLVAQASKRAMETATQRWSEIIAAKPDDPMNAMLLFYLSPEHLEEKRDCCPLATLGADAARQGPEVKASFETGIKAHLQVLASLVPADMERDGKMRSLTMLSLMVGALTLARMVNDETLATDLLDAATDTIREIFKVK